MPMHEIARSLVAHFNDCLTDPSRLGMLAQVQVQELHAALPLMHELSRHWLRWCNQARIGDDNPEVAATADKLLRAMHDLLQLAALALFIDRERQKTPDLQQPGVLFPALELLDRLKAEMQQLQTLPSALKTLPNAHGDLPADIRLMNTSPASAALNAALGRITAASFSGSGR